jgi:predicted house-cleaning noncanonical NTP pyrophosphatase (MazG superfamily)
MSWKLVRDHNEKWCRANGVSGRWRKSPDPVSALTRKLFEEAGEFAEQRDPAELYDLLDVINALLEQLDLHHDVSAEHAQKVARFGGFITLTEWTPLPEGVRDFADSCTLGCPVHDPSERCDS